MELIAVLKNHFSPPSLILAERFQFGIRNQKVGESVTEFATALRALTAKCEFGTFLDDALSLRFVCGIRDKSTQKRLLLLKNPTFKEVLDTAVKCESADRHMELMNDSQQEGSVLQMRRNPSNNNRYKRKQQNNPCFRCGRRNHTPDKCYFIADKCHECGEVGHIVKMCRNPKKGRARGPVRNVRAMTSDPNPLSDGPAQVNSKCVLSCNSNLSSPKSINNSKTRIRNSQCRNKPLVHANTGNNSEGFPGKNHASDNTEIRPAPIYHLAKQNDETAGTVIAAHESTDNNVHESIDRINNCLLNGSESIYVTPMINGKPVKMELDTGSAVSIMNLEDYRKYFPGGDGRLRRSALVLRTYTGEQVRPIGVAWVYVGMNKTDQRKCVRLYVVNKGSNPLFGRSWLKALYGNDFLRIDTSYDTVSDSTLIDPHQETNFPNTSPILSIGEGTDPVTLSKRKGFVNKILENYSNLFDGSLGKLNNIQGKLYVDKEAKPVFCKARPVPFTQEEAVNREIDRLVEMGVGYFVPYSDWATPAVPVMKKKMVT